jgi:hypothetical protein
VHAFVEFGEYCPAAHDSHLDLSNVDTVPGPEVKTKLREFPNSKGHCKQLTATIALARLRTAVLPIATL